MTSPRAEPRVARSVHAPGLSEPFALVAPVRLARDGGVVLVDAAGATLALADAPDTEGEGRCDALEQPPRVGGGGPARTRRTAGARPTRVRTSDRGHPAPCAAALMALPKGVASGTFAAMFTPASDPHGHTHVARRHANVASRRLVLVGLMLFSALGACAGTHAGQPFRRAKLAAADEFDCPPADIRETGGQEWDGGSRYALDACGVRHTYECDDEGCERVCDYVPRASTFTGTGPAEGEYGELVHHWALAEFDCLDVRQVDRSGDDYTLFVCGNEVVYDCGDDGCERRCD